MLRLTEGVRFIDGIDDCKMNNGGEQVGTKGFSFNFVAMTAVVSALACLKTKDCNGCFKENINS